MTCRLMSRTWAVALVLVLPVGACTSPSSEDGGGGLGGNLKNGSVPAQYVTWINKAGNLCPQVKPPLVAAQLYQESKFNPKAGSPVGAQGIAQFMPSSWPANAEDVDHNGSASPWDAPDAIIAQGKLMCQLASQASSALSAHKVSGDLTQLVLAGYNAGWGNVLKYGGVPPFAETQQYVQLIPKNAISNYGGINASSVSAGGGQIVGDVTGKVKPIISAGQGVLGLPYVWGGGTLTGPSGTDRVDGRGPGFDCSGFTRYATYLGTGGKVTLPRTAAEQQAYTASYDVGSDMSKWKPGDLLFWGSPAHHVAIYMGGGQIIEAPRDTEDVHVTRMWGAADAHRPPWLK